MNLTFRAPGEELIVMAALAEVCRIRAPVEQLRTACRADDLAGLLVLAEIADYAEETQGRHEKRRDRVRLRLARESDEADAVGAAHGDALALLPANPLLLDPARQELPAGESVVHDQPNRSAVR